MNQPLTNTAKIFIVDDNNSICTVLKWLFEEIAQIEVIIYQDARHFLNEYHPAWHGCLIIDLLMPGMSGLELLEELKLRNNTMPVIFLTGHGDVFVAKQALQAGASHYITKPFDTNELLNKVCSLIKNS